MYANYNNNNNINITPAKSTSTSTSTTTSTVVNGYIESKNARIEIPSRSTIWKSVSYWIAATRNRNFGGKKESYRVWIKALRIELSIYYRSMHLSHTRTYTMRNSFCTRFWPYNNAIQPLNSATFVRNRFSDLCRLCDCVRVCVRQSCGTPCDRLKCGNIFHFVRINLRWE